MASAFAKMAKRFGSGRVPSTSGRFASKVAPGPVVGPRTSSACCVKSAAALASPARCASEAWTISERRRDSCEIDRVLPPISRSRSRLYSASPRVGRAELSRLSRARREKSPPRTSIACGRLGFSGPSNGERWFKLQNAASGNGFWKVPGKFTQVR